MSKRKTKERGKQMTAEMRNGLPLSNKEHYYDTRNIERKLFPRSKYSNASYNDVMRAGHEDGSDIIIRNILWRDVNRHIIRWKHLLQSTE